MGGSSSANDSVKIEFFLVWDLTFRAIQSGPNDNMEERNGEYGKCVFLLLFVLLKVYFVSHSAVFNVRKATS